MSSHIFVAFITAALRVDESTQVFYTEVSHKPLEV